MFLPDGCAASVSGAGHAARDEGHEAPQAAVDAQRRGELAEMFLAWCGRAEELRGKFTAIGEPHGEVVIRHHAVQREQRGAQEGSALALALLEDDFEHESFGVF